MSELGLDPTKLDGLPMGVAVQVKLTIHHSGALSIEGPIHDQRWMIALFENAIDAVRNHHGPKSKPGLVIPEKDIAVPDQLPKIVV